MAGNKPKSPAQLDREITEALARSGPRYLLTSRQLIEVEQDGERDTLTWEDFADANREMPELNEVARSLRRSGRATIGGGAAPLTVVRIVR